MLVYDGKTKIFRRVARWIDSQSDEVILVPWRAPGAKKFITEQFGDHLFAFVLVDIDREQVHAGSETVVQLLRSHGAPWPLVASAERAYVNAAGPVGEMLHGQRPANLDGSYPLADAARPHLEALQRDRSRSTTGDPSEKGV